MPDNQLIAPSLYEVFQAERDGLISDIGGSDMSSAQIVTAARKALDRTGKAFAETTPDVKLQRAGLWLLEMIKSGASILDQGTKAEIIWHEVPAKPRPLPWGQVIFYAAGIGIVLWSLFIASRAGVIAGAILMVLRFLDPQNWKGRLPRLKFWIRKQPKLEFGDEAVRAEARIHVNANGFVSSLSDALKTADHILSRLGEPKLETHWREDKRLIHFIQGLLEAEMSKDGDFALTLITKELESILAAEGIQRLEYNKKTSQYFDVMPSLDQTETKVAAPALKAGDHLIARGTVWSSDE